MTIVSQETMNKHDLMLIHSEMAESGFIPAAINGDEAHHNRMEKNKLAESKRKDSSEVWSCSLSEEGDV